MFIIPLGRAVVVLRWARRMCNGYRKGRGEGWKSRAEGGEGIDGLDKGATGLEDEDGRRLGVISVEGGRRGG